MNSTDASPMLPVELLKQLGARSAELEASGEWPAAQMDLLRQAGVFQWGIPPEFGGRIVSPAEWLEIYLALSEQCLTTAFILTQRNAACQRLVQSQSSVREKWLPLLAAGSAHATVGISHLSTSRQHITQPAVTVLPSSEGYLVQGEVPWVTGAAQSDLLVTGGTLPDGLQVLLAVETKVPGVEVGPASDLLALAGSQTASVKLTGLRVPATALLAGPASQVLQQGVSGGTGSLTTSALALGTAHHALWEMAREARIRPNLESLVERFALQISKQVVLLFQAADESIPADERPTATEVRQQANSLAIRTTQALLTISKGAGYVRGHPAERLVREALFFLVWSCPQPVVSAALEEFAMCSQGN